MRKPGDLRAGLVPLAHTLTQLREPIHDNLDRSDANEPGQRRQREISTRDNNQAVLDRVDVMHLP